MNTTFAEDIKHAQKGENIGDPIDTYVFDYTGMVLSRMFIRLHVIPNVITVLSGIVGVTGGLLLCFNTLPLTILAVFLIFLATSLDASDGQVARLTKRYSDFGRELDGAADFMGYLALHTGLCVRLFHAKIPFTEAEWGFRIIIVAAIGIYFFLAQSRTVDYFKNLHIYMRSRGQHGEHTRVNEITKQIKAAKKPSFEWLRLLAYREYTRVQEMETPKTQKLLDKVEATGNIITQQLSDAYYAKSKKLVLATNILAYNLRMVVLFIALFLPGHLEFLYFAFVFFFIEPARIVIITKYEKLAARLTKQDLFADTEK